MKVKFWKRFGKRIAMLLIAAMLFTDNGMTTLAAGVGGAQESYAEDAMDLLAEESEAEEETVSSDDAALEAEEETVSADAAMEAENAAAEAEAVTQETVTRPDVEDLRQMAMDAAEEDEEAAAGAEPLPAGEDSVSAEASAAGEEKASEETVAAGEDKASAETVAADEQESPAGDDALQAPDEDGAEAAVSGQEIADAEDDASQADVLEEIEEIEEIDPAADMGWEQDAADAAEETGSDADDAQEPEVSGNAVSDNEVSMNGIDGEEFDVIEDGEFGVLDDPEDDVIEGATDGMNWSLASDGTLTISGTYTGSTVFNSTSWPWLVGEGNAEKIKSVQINNLSGLKNTSFMFYNCTQLRSVSITNFDVTGVTDMTMMFAQSGIDTTLDLSGIKNASSVKNVMGMFFKCDSMTTPPKFGNVFKSAQINSVLSMFSDCSKLSSFTFWTEDDGAVGVTDIGGMFNNCKAMTTLDLSGLNAASVTNASNLVNGASALTEIKTPKNVKIDIKLNGTWYDWTTGATTTNVTTMPKTAASATLKKEAPAGAPIAVTVVQPTGGGSIKIYNASTGSEITAGEVAKGTSIKIKIVPPSGKSVQKIDLYSSKYPGGEYHVSSGWTNVSDGVEYAYGAVNEGLRIECTFQDGSTVTDPEEKINVDVKITGNGTVTVGTASAVSSSGKVEVPKTDTMTVVVTPASGFEISDLSYTDKGGNTEKPFVNKVDRKDDHAKVNGGVVTLSFAKKDSDYIINDDFSVSVTFTAKEGGGDDPVVDTEKCVISGLAAEGVDVYWKYSTDTVYSPVASNGSQEVDKASTVNVKVTPKSTVAKTYTRIKSIKNGTTAVAADSDSEVVFNIANVQGPVAVTIQTVPTYEISCAAGIKNGSIALGADTSGKTSVRVEKGSNFTVKVTPRRGCKTISFKDGDTDLLGQITDVKNAYTYTLTNVTSPHAFTAAFEVMSFQVSFNKIENASVKLGGTPYEGPVPVQAGDNITLSIQPDTGAKLSTFTVNGVDKKAQIVSNRYVFTDIQENQLIDLVYEKVIKYVTITMTEGSGFTWDWEKTDGNAEKISANAIKAEENASITIKITAQEGKEIDKITVNNKTWATNCGKTKSVPLTNLSEEKTIVVTVKDAAGTVVVPDPVKHKLTVKKPAGGSITSNVSFTYDTPVELDADGQYLFTIKADSGKEIAGISMNGVSVLGKCNQNQDGSRKFILGGDNFTQDTDLEALFKDGEVVKQTVTVQQPSAGGKVEIVGKTLTDGKLVVNRNDKITIKATASDNYVLKSILINDLEQEDSNGTLSYTMVRDITVTAEFEPVVYYPVTVETEGKGKVTSNPAAGADGKISVKKGDSVTFTITPDANCTIDDILVNGASTGSHDKTYKLENVTEETTFKVVFGENAVYSIGIMDCVNGAIKTDRKVTETAKILKIGGKEFTVPRTVSANKTEDVAFTFVPDKGFMLDVVSVNGVAVSVSGNAYKITNVNTDNVIEAFFKVDDAAATISVNVAGFGTISINTVTGAIMAGGKPTVSGNGRANFRIFGGWTTKPDGAGELIIDAQGNVVAGKEILMSLKPGDMLYEFWQNAAVVEKQKLNVASSFDAEIAAYLAANAKGKYKYAVCTLAPMQGAASPAPGTMNKIGSVTKKGVFTAKKAGTAKVYVLFYNPVTKKYDIESTASIVISVEKMIVSKTKITLNHAGANVGIDELLGYGYPAGINYKPNYYMDGDVVYTSAQEGKLVHVDPKTGMVTALDKSGTAKIKVTYSLSYDPAKPEKKSKVTKIMNVYVKNPKFKASKYTMKTVGKSMQKTNTLLNLREGDTVIYTSSNEAVAVVSPVTGNAGASIVTAKSAGVAVIKAQVHFRDGAVGEYSYTVTVK